MIEIRHRECEVCGWQWTERKALQEGECPLCSAVKRIYDHLDSQQEQQQPTAKERLREIILSHWSGRRSVVDDLTADILKWHEEFTPKPEL